MRLSSLTERTLRTLIFLGVHRDRIVPLAQVARSYRIPEEELQDVERLLERLGLVEVVENDGEGLRLAVGPERINVGWLIRRTEPDMAIVECFDRDAGTCPIAPACMLKNILNQARQDFLSSLDRFTLADCLASPRRRLAFVRLWNAAASDSPDDGEWTST